MVYETQEDNKAVYVEGGTKELKIVEMDLCIRDPKTGTLKCVKGGYKARIEITRPKEVEV